MSEIAVNFQAHGIANVLQAFATIDKQAQKFGATITRNERIITTAVTKETAKQQDAHVKTYERIMRADMKATARMIEENKRLADKKIKEAERSVRAQIRLEDQAEKAYERSLRNRTKEFERETKKVNRIAERANRERIRSEEAATKAGTQRMRSFGTNAGSLVTSAGGRVLGGIGTAAAGIMAVGGGFSAVDAVQTGIANRGRAADLSIASNGELRKGDIYSAAASTATAYGTSTENAIGAMDRFYAKSGDAKKAMAIMPDMLALATATGGNAGEISEAAGQVSNADKSLTAKQVADVTRGWAGQGRAGSIDMRELASNGAALAAGAALFSGDQATNMIKLGGIAQQSTAGGSKSAAEAAESVARLASDAFKHGEQLKSLGVESKDKYGRLVDPETLIKRSVIATKGDRTKLQSAFGEMSIRAVGGYANVYGKARVSALEGGASEKDAAAAGEKAMDEAFKVWNDAALTEKQVREDAAKRLAEVDKKIESAMNLLREKVADALIPKLTELLPKLVDLIPAFADLLVQLVAVADWMAKNPFKAILALIAASIAKDVAAVGLGKLMAKMFSTMGNGTRFGSGGIGAPIPGLGGKVTRGGLGVAGSIGAAAGIAGLAFAAGEAGIAGIDMVMAANKASRDNLQKGDIGASNSVAAAVGMGGGTAEALQKKKDALEAAQKAMSANIQEKANSIGDKGIMENVLGWITTKAGSTASADREAADKRSLKQSVDEMAALAETIKKVDDALSEMAKTAKKVEIKDPKNTVPLSGDARTK